MSKHARMMLVATGTALLLATGSAGAQTSTVSTASTSEVFLRPGDFVRITVWDKPEYNGEFLVAADSALSHPLFQTVKVAGVPIAVAKERLRTLLATRENTPLIILEPLFQVSVMGEVRIPNLYALPRATTVAQAIARAGGPTENAKISAVRLLRDDRELTIDLNDPESANALLLIRSGDRLVVRRKGNFLQDVLMPVASLTAAVVSVVVAIRQ